MCLARCLGDRRTICIRELGPARRPVQTKLSEPVACGLGLSSILSEESKTAFVISISI